LPEWSGYGLGIQRRIEYTYFAGKVHEGRDRFGGYAEIVLCADEVHAVGDMLDGWCACDGGQMEREAGSGWDCSDVVDFKMAV
jgi:hypothetical protein